MAEIWLTQEEFEKRKAHLDYLKSTRTLEIAEMLKIARGFGDLSENAEYDAAKAEQAKNEYDIATLEAELRTAKMLAKVMDNVPIKIHEFDEIVGRPTPGVIGCQTAISVCGDYIHDIWNDDGIIGVTLDASAILSREELEVLRELVLTEDKQTVISERLSIQVKSLQKYVTQLYRKTGAATRSGLTELYHNTMIGL